MKKKLRIGVFFTILPPLFNKCCKDCLLFCWQIQLIYVVSISRFSHGFYANRDIDLSTSEKTHKFVDIRYKLKGGCSNLGIR